MGERDPMTQYKRDIAILDASQEAFKDVPAEDVEGEITKAIAEVRAEKRSAKKRSAGLL